MKIRRRPGQTLIEVTMATMIAAITTTAVFSVVLSSFVSGARADKRDAAAMAIRYAQETLKGFVSAEPTNAMYEPTSTLPKPSYEPGTPGLGRWPADSSNVWALREGTHYISSIVSNAAGSPLSPAGSPAAVFTYTVTTAACGSMARGAAPDYPTGCKTVFFSLSYTD